ncbi:MAG: hypothetical protein H0T51_08330 [Pirellulales bacterium]|nr:hypothetical protein [Pirellulales bacterium]
MKSITMNSLEATLRVAMIAALTSLSFAFAAHAAPVTDFRTYRASPATTLAGQGTDDPVVGDLVGNTADSSFVIGYLPTPAVLGANVGDKITLTFGVSFNDTAGIVNGGDNFRFALFDLNGEAQDSATGGFGGGPNYDTAGTGNTDDFRGYWLGVRNGSGTGSGGSIRERIATLVSGQNAFAATGTNGPTAPSLGAVGGDPVTLTSDLNGDGNGADYSGVLTLTRNASNLVDVSGSFIGTNGLTGNVFMASDTTVPSPSTYGAIGFLIGNALDVEQVIFQNIDVAVIPAGATQDADFDGDSDIDGEDFLIWQRGLGGTNVTNANGNADGDGDVDGDDLAVWKTQFGTIPAAVSVGAVPEPGALTLGGMTLATLAGVARRRCARLSRGVTARR